MNVEKKSTLYKLSTICLFFKSHTLRFLLATFLPYTHPVLDTPSCLIQTLLKFIFLNSNYKFVFTFCIDKIILETCNLLSGNTRKSLVCSIRAEMQRFDHAVELRSVTFVDIVSDHRQLTSHLTRRPVTTKIKEVNNNLIITQANRSN